MRKKYRIGLIRIFMVIFAVCTSATAWKITGEKKKSEVSTSRLSEEMVIPGGMPIGIYLETEGVLVLGTEKMECTDGVCHEPAEYVVREGDYIVAFNHEEVENKKELVQCVSRLDNRDVILTIRRSGEEMDVKIRPAEVKNGEYKLGIWVRDNAQGLGTLTYLTAESSFGALGHGIHDTDTDVLLDISGGNVYKTTIRGVHKGEAGSPGGLEGIIVYNPYNVLGTITDNTETGIYGTIDKIDALFADQEPVKICKKEDIRTGKATILCTVDGERREYEIELERIELYSRNANKGIVLKVTDEELLQATGGIVQGMSGSPILQDGKIIGAVTHVCVNL